MSDRTVLILDDDTEFRAFLTSLMTPRGYEVLEAARIAEARVLLERRTIQLAIVDGLLPDGTGMAFIAELRQRDQQLKIIFMSAFWRDIKTYRTLTEQLHVTRVINKPFLAREFLVQLEAMHAEPVAAAGVPADARGSTPVVEAPGFEAQLAALREAYGAKLDEKIRELSEAYTAARSSGGGREPLEHTCHLAHRLHGTAGAYGFSEVSTAAGVVENVVREILQGRLEPGVLAWRQINRALRQLGDAQNRRRAVLLVSGPGGSVERYRKFDLRLLVTDSDPAVLAAAEAAGRRNLVEVLSAATVDEALARAGDGGLDGALIGLDGWATPDAGLRVAAALRATDAQSALPIVFVSSDSAVPSRVAAVYAGGSLFLTRPLDQPALAAAFEHIGSLKRAEQSRALVVDDDPAFVEHISSLLRAEGMKVSSLGDPARILEALAETHPDVLLLDVILPAVSGYDLCKLIRATPEWQALPILFLTVKLEADDRLACFEAGGDDYLPKPILAAELLARIRVRLDRARLHRERVNRDSLTGLLARQAFAETVEKRLAENRRLMRPLALCLLDIDHFKVVNDTHGHLAGDRVLHALGKLLHSRFRIEDVRGRWGGEEFVVAFNGEGAETAREMLGRVLYELRQMIFQGDGGDTFSTTFSAGVGVFPDDGYTLEELIRAADRRLYMAKEAGRDRIVI